jgi:hypothetical protein
MTRQLGSGRRTDATPDYLRAEQVFLRSFDHRRGYDLEVELRRPDGEPVLDRRYYLPPGGTASELDLDVDGRYAVRVTMDNGVSRERECRVGPAPADTLVVEVGNGALSLTQGLAG